jgi:hypothetical protein
MSATSTLTGQALQASRAALSAALADQAISTDDEGLLEPGEIQEVEVDMQAQAEGIKTVFSDPTNFNVKVCGKWITRLGWSNSGLVASLVLSLDTLVRLAFDKRSQPATDTCVSIPADPHPSDTWCRCSTRVDGGH